VPDFYDFGGGDTSNKEGSEYDESDLMVFVGDIPKDATETDVKNAFVEYGFTVHDVIIKYSKQTGQPIGYGFVKLTSIEEVNQSIAKSNNIKINGKDIRINHAQRSCILHISNLSDSVTIDNLNKLFLEYGEIQKADTTISSNGSVICILLYNNQFIL
jgi:RNA recognition motif-containing protein